MTIYAKFARFYDEIMGDRTAEVEQIREYITRYMPTATSLLELGCGTGALLAGLASDMNVTGIDQSPEMLALARAAADRSGVPITWLEQDMRELRLPEPVDAATCLYDSLNYLVDEGELRRAMSAIAVSLRPAGLFLFDMNTVRGLATRWGNRVWIIQDSDDAFEADQSEFDYDAGVATLRVNAFLHRPNGLYERVREVHRERGYPIPTIDAALETGGFEVLGRWSSPSFDPVTSETGRLFYAARRL